MRNSIVVILVNTKWACWVGYIYGIKNQQIIYLCNVSEIKKYILLKKLYVIRNLYSVLKLSNNIHFSPISNFMDWVALQFTKIRLYSDRVNATASKLVFQAPHSSQNISVIKEHFSIVQSHHISNPANFKLWIWGIVIKISDN